MGRLTKLLRFISSILDPRVYLHFFRLAHYFNYSHVRERRLITIGPQTAIAPNVSFRNGERIVIGRKSHIGERCYLWAGNETGRILIGDHVSLAPEVFITASDYQFVAGVPFRDQPKRERDVKIGDDVWLGTGVVVTAGVEIGSGCIVGAGAVVTKSLPPNSIAGGVPAKVISSRLDASS
jgi:acetyltransferase-like isoleucine patch superfamily enzyme